MGTTTPRRRAKRGSGEQLRGEILDAAKALLAETGNADAVSIRAVADVVGVTPPSIYLHFADKDALLEAVVADLFVQLDERMRAAASPDAHPMERMCQQGMAYVQFALDAPEHYRLATMLMRESGDRINEVLRTAAFANLSQTVLECMDIGVFQRGDPTPIVLELWAAAHGIVSLLITKPNLPWGNPLDVAYNVLRAAGVGRAVVEHVGEDITPVEFGTWLANLPQNPAPR